MNDPLILTRRSAYRRSGFLIQQRAGSDMVQFEDLSPTISFSTQLGRLERLKLAWWFLLAAVFPA